MKQISFLAILIAFGSFSCKKDTDNVKNPPKDEEKELITTFKLLFTDSLHAGQSFEVVYKDIDGDGGLIPSKFDTIVLDTAKVYLVSVVLLNESKTPVDTVSNEIIKEASDHLFCYGPTPNLLEIKLTDTDGAIPLGIQSTWTTTSNAGNGSVRIRLKHQPGIKSGACDLGETDIDLTFQLKVSY
jgi:hypothetical protein